MFKKLNYDQAHKFVESTPGAFWVGWTMVLFTPNPKGATSKYGMFRDGKWGMARRIEPNNRGEWSVKVGNVSSGRTRS